MDKISIIIPSYNRFKYLLNALNSIYNQTYKNFEVIIVNDCSTEQEYYSYIFPDNTTIIHLQKNSKYILGRPCIAFVRNEGIKKANGKYIAFLDDDDIWFSSKLEEQLEYMKINNCKMCCSDSFIGNGLYDKNKSYKLYNKSYYYRNLKNFYRNTKYLKNGFELIWTLDFIKIHNCIITSSVIVEKELLEIINYMPLVNPYEDYNCWIKLLEYTNCVYIDKPLLYYDKKHANGSMWKK